jgi:antagonist of KipI
MKDEVKSRENEAGNVSQIAIPHPSPLAPKGGEATGGTQTRILHPCEIEVLEPGLSTTLQDLGRPGGRRYGVPPGGALDRFAHVAANKLVQNPPGAATLEITLQGPRLLFLTSALIAVTGADLRPFLNGRPIPGWMSVFVRAGQILEFQAPLAFAKNTGGGGRAWGGRAYLAIHGGFEAPLALDSRSTYLRAKLGGYKGLGRALQAGDVLKSVPGHLRHFPEAAGRAFPAEQRPAYGRRVTARVVPGPYQEHFDDHTYQTLFNETYTLAPQSDRMGFRLEGPPLLHRQPELAEIAACGAVFGAIQVPANGQPIVLMADHQVTGGYPIIGTVLSADLPLLAQLLPGDEVQFSSQ